LRRGLEGGRIERSTKEYMRRGFQGQDVESLFSWKYGLISFKELCLKHSKIAQL